MSLPGQQQHLVWSQSLQRTQGQLSSPKAAFRQAPQNLIQQHSGLPTAQVARSLPISFSSQYATQRLAPVAPSMPFNNPELAVSSPKFATYRLEYTPMGDNIDEWDKFYRVCHTTML